MKLRIQTICRGSGKVHLLVDAFFLPENSKLLLSTATTSGQQTPSSLFPYEGSLIEANGDMVKEYVATLPLLSMTQIMHFEVTDMNNQVIHMQDIPLSPSRAKWASRFNYRFHAKEAKEIRDFDENRSFNVASFEFWEAMPFGSEDLIRGIAKVPLDVVGSIKILCSSQSYTSLSDKVTILGDRVYANSGASEESFREILFSIRVPQYESFFLFEIRDEANNKLLGFDVIEMPDFQYLLQQGQLYIRNAQNDPFYHEWLLAERAHPNILERQRSYHFASEPLFSIVVPLYKTPLPFFNEMVNSVKSQTYARWELILVNASKEDVALSESVKKASQEDQRIKLITLESNLGITLNTNEGLEAATGDFVCFFDHDDLLEPDALFEYARAINQNSEIDILYCDEDKLQPDGSFCQPYFKPEFSIDLLRSNNYICHMLAIRKSLLDTIPRQTAEFDGAQDHNLTLLASEKSRHIHRVPKILYHWRISANSTANNADSKPYATTAGIKAVQNHLNRLGINASVTQARRPFTYLVEYAIESPEPLVSIIIPSKDQVAFLDRCISSIIKKTTYKNYEIVIVENNSIEEETFAYYKQIEAALGNLRIECWPAEFNFSKIINFGVSKARGDFLLFLNNDTEVLTSCWIEQMLGICQRSDVGVVGVRLYYPDDTIQHAGLCVSGGVAGHLNRLLPRVNHGYFSLIDLPQNFSAVTAACMMTKRNIFEEVGGFTEELAVAFNDVDFCLKIREKGRLVVYTPEVNLYHYESVSRGREDDPEKRIRFAQEYAYMREAWKKYYVFGDPYMNPNLNKAEPFHRYYHLKSLYKQNGFR